MTGVETIVVILKAGVPIITILLTAIGKFLYDIKASSKKTELDFHSFKTDFTVEISSIKNDIKRLNDRITDSYSKPESDNRLLTLENKLMKELTDSYTKLRDLIYSTINRSNQKNNNTTKD